MWARRFFVRRNLTLPMDGILNGTNRAICFHGVAYFQNLAINKIASARAVLRCGSRLPHAASCPAAGYTLFATARQVLNEGRFGPPVSTESAPFKYVRARGMLRWAGALTQGAHTA